MIRKIAGVVAALAVAGLLVLAMTGPAAGTDDPQSYGVPSVSTTTWTTPPPKAVPPSTEQRLSTTGTDVRAPLIAAGILALVGTSLVLARRKRA